MEKYDGKSRGKWKNWELRRKIKMRGGNVAGSVSEECKEAGSRWDALRVGREAEHKWRGVPCQASLCFCRMNPLHAASAPVPFLTLTLISLELWGLHVPIPSSSRRVSCGKFWRRKPLARGRITVNIQLSWQLSAQIPSQMRSLSDLAQFKLLNLSLHSPTHTRGRKIL